jgi:outer membrane protein OmpA-like peptidoglycan-associated protein
MRNSFRAVTFLISLVAILPASPEMSYLLQSESPGVPDAQVLDLRAVAGYESGYIPDGYFGAEIGFGFSDWLHIGGGLGAAQLLDQQQFRLSGFELSSRMSLWRGAREDALTVYLKYAQSLGDPVILDYPGPLTDVGSVISPRADSGIDLIAGAAGCVSHASGLSLLFDAEYARTELRTWYPLFDQEGSKNRLFLNVVPAFFFSNSLMTGVQNRLTWWFDRGFMYDIMPQVNWEIFPGFMVSVGGAAPVVGGGVWKAYVSVSYEIDTESQFAVIQEGGDVRLRVYFNFLGDKSDLFGPQNAKFGEQNRRLVDKVAAFIQKYEGYAIVVEGHTNRAKFDMSFNDEQTKEMMPLARARAAAVREALIRKGFKPARITIQAYGALHPLADFKDDANNWKNRRVEILLTKGKAGGG